MSSHSQMVLVSWWNTTVDLQSIMASALFHSGVHDGFWCAFGALTQDPPKQVRDESIPHSLDLGLVRYVFLQPSQHREWL